TRHRNEDEVLPWDHISAGLHRDFLWLGWKGALAEHGLPGCCWAPCYACGVGTDYALHKLVAWGGGPAAGGEGARAEFWAGRQRAGAVPAGEGRCPSMKGPR